jgi:carbamoyltransferase
MPGFSTHDGKTYQLLKQFLKKISRVLHLNTLSLILTKRIDPIRQHRAGVLDQYPPRQLFTPNHYLRISKNTSKCIAPIMSLVTPSYNQGRYIKDTIQSILGQGYSNLEYIVQDGNSADDTLKILEGFREKITHFESQADGGQANAINLGFQKSTGEIMAYLNSDDILLPGTLNYVANYFMQHPHVDVIYGHRIIINEHGEEIGRWVLPPHDENTLLWSDLIPQETLFWRRTLWDKVGGSLDESFQFAMDWDLLLRFHSAKAIFNRVPRFLAAFRVHSMQKTSMHIHSTGFEEMKRLRNRIHGRDVDMQEVQKNINFYVTKSILYHLLYRMGIFRY